MVNRLATTDSTYVTGALSPYPQAIDSSLTLYAVSNNATTVLTQSLSYGSQSIIVADASAFPQQGIITVGTEIIYYAFRTDTVFSQLDRGFAGSQQNSWLMGTTVNNPVAAEEHNALKDAVINIENNLGLSVNPTATSLNGILSALEVRFLAPKPLFRGFPIVGAPPLQVTFHNFSDGPTVRFLWDFGDNTTSVEQNPVHTYASEGTYTVTLSVITSLGAQGIITKTGYVTVDSQQGVAFFYVDQVVGVSQRSATIVSPATTFNFVDQTEGDIVARYWIWDDGNTTVVSDPDIQTASYVYPTPGQYEPILLVSFSNSILKRILLGEVLLVS